jgi:hypothetical protein
MIQEDKTLLLKDLCARLPYGVKYCRDSWNYEWDQEMSVVEVLEDIDKEGYINYHKVYKVDDIKPYLRPLSSITKEEELHIKLNLGFYLHDGVFDNVDIFTTSGIYDRDGNYYPPEKCRCTVQITIYKVLEFLHYLHSHHFDYRGLIEKGLALEAPEGMYKND